MDRRVFELEQKVSHLIMTTAVTEAKVDGLVETIKSRFKAFDRGLELILEKFKPLDGISASSLKEGQLALYERVTELEKVRNKAAGALIAVQVLAATGIIGGVVAIAKMLKG